MWKMYRTNRCRNKVLRAVWCRWRVCKGDVPCVWARSNIYALKIRRQWYTDLYARTQANIAHITGIDPPAACVCATHSRVCVCCAFIITSKYAKRPYKQQSNELVSFDLPNPFIYLLYFFPPSLFLSFSYTLSFASHCILFCFLFLRLLSFTNNFTLLNV